MFEMKIQSNCVFKICNDKAMFQRGLWRIDFIETGRWCLVELEIAAKLLEKICKAQLWTLSSRLHELFFELRAAK